MGLKGEEVGIGGLEGVEVVGFRWFAWSKLAYLALHGGQSEVRLRPTAPAAKVRFFSLLRERKLNVCDTPLLVWKAC